MESIPDPVDSSAGAEESTSQSATDSPTTSGPKRWKRKKRGGKDSECNTPESSKASSPAATSKKGRKKKKTCSAESVNSSAVTALGDGSGSVWSQLGAFKCKICGFTTTEENFFNCHICSMKRSLASSPSSPRTAIISGSALTKDTAPAPSAPSPGVRVNPAASSLRIFIGSVAELTHLPSSSALNSGLRVVPAAASPVIATSSGSVLTQNAVPSTSAPSPGLMVVPAASSTVTATSSGSALRQNAVPSSSAPSPGLRVVPSASSPVTGYDSGLALRKNAMPAKECSVPKEAASAVPRKGFIRYESETESKDFVCMQCGYRGKDRYFIEHLMYQVISNPYHCQHCSGAFADRPSFQEHCEQEHKGQKLECKLKRVGFVRDIMNRATEDSKVGKLTEFSFHPAFKACVRKKPKVGMPGPLPSCSQTVVAMPVTGYCSRLATASTVAVSSASEHAGNATSSAAACAATSSASVNGAKLSATVNATPSSATVSTPTLSATVSDGAATSSTTVGVTSSATVNASSPSPPVSAATSLATVVATSSSPVSTMSSSTVNATSSSTVTATTSSSTVGATTSSSAISATASSVAVSTKTSSAAVSVTALSATVSVSTSSLPVHAASASETESLATVGPASSATVSVSAKTSSIFPDATASSATVGATSSTTVKASTPTATVDATVSPATVSATSLSTTVKASTSTATVDTTASSDTGSTILLSATVKASMSSATVDAFESSDTVSATPSSPTVKSSMSTATVDTTASSYTVRATSSSTTVKASMTSATVDAFESSDTVSATSSSPTVKASMPTAIVDATASSDTVSATSSSTTVKASTSTAIVDATASSDTVSATSSSTTVKASTSTATADATASLDTISATSSSTTVKASMSTATADAAAASDTVDVKASSTPLNATLSLASTSATTSSAAVTVATSPATVSTATLSSASEVLPPSSSTIVPTPGQEESAASDTPLSSLSHSEVMQTAEEKCSALMATDEYQLDLVVTSHSQVTNPSSPPTVHTGVSSESESPLACTRGAKLAADNTLAPPQVSDQTDPVQNSGTVDDDHKPRQIDDEVASDKFVESCGEDPDVPVIIACQGNYTEHEGDECGVSPSVDDVSNRQTVPCSLDQPTHAISSATVTSPVVVLSKAPAVPVVSRHACSVSNPAVVVPSQAQHAFVVTSRTASLAALTSQAGPNSVPVMSRQSCPVPQVLASIVPSRSQSVPAATGQMGFSAALPNLVGLGTVPVAHGLRPGSLLSSCQFTSSATASPLRVSVQTRPSAQNVQNHLVLQRVTNADTQQSFMHQWRYKHNRPATSAQSVRRVLRNIASSASNQSPSYSTPTVSQVSTQFSCPSPAANLQNRFVAVNLVNSDRIRFAYHGASPQQLQQLSPTVPLPLGVILPNLIGQPATNQVQPATIMRYVVPGTASVAQSSSVQNTLPVQGLQPALGHATLTRNGGPQQQLPDKPTPQDVFTNYSPISPASSVSPVYTPVSPVYTPISPVYTPISPASPAHSPEYSPVSPPASSPVQQAACASAMQLPLDLSSTMLMQNPETSESAYAAVTVPSQSPGQGSTSAGRVDVVAAASSAALSSHCPITISVTADPSAGTATVKQEKTDTSSGKSLSMSGATPSVSDESSSQSENSSSASVPATTAPPASTSGQADDSLCMCFIKWKNYNVCLLCGKKFLDSGEFYIHVWNHQHASGEKCSSCSANPASDMSTQTSCLKTTSVLENISCNANAQLLNYLSDDCREKLSRRLLPSDAIGGPSAQRTETEADETASHALKSADALPAHAGETSVLMSEQHLQREGDGDPLREAEVDPQRETEEAPLSEAEMDPQRETEEDPLREAEEDPLRGAGEDPQADKGLLREAEKGPVREVEKNSLRDVNEDPVRETEGNAPKESDEGNPREADDPLREAGENSPREADEKGDVVPLNEADEDPQRDAEVDPRTRREAALGIEKGEDSQDRILGSEANPEGPVARVLPTERVNVMYDHHTVFFICPFCSFSCDMAIDFTMHLNSDHPHEESYLCSHCHYRGQYTTDLTNHMTAHTAGDSKIYPCPFAEADGCGFHTGNLKNLAHHMKMHETDTSYWCQKCASQFPDDMAFLHHLRLNSMTLFTCSKCPSRFLRKQAIQQHWQAQHSGGLAFRVLKMLLCSERKDNGYHPPSQGLLRRRSSDELSDDVSYSESNATGASENLVPVSESPAPVTKNLVLDSESPLPVQENPVQVSESSLPVQENPVQVSESPVSVLEVPVQVSESPVPVSEVPVQVSESPVSVLEVPVQVSESPVPVSEVPVQVSESPVPVSEVPVSAGIADSGPGNETCAGNSPLSTWSSARDKMPQASASTCAVDEPAKPVTAGGDAANPYNISKERMGIFRHLASQIKLPPKIVISVDEEVLYTEPVVISETVSIPEDSGDPSLETEGPSSIPREKQELCCNTPMLEDTTRADESHMDTNNQTIQPDHQHLFRGTDRVLPSDDFTPDVSFPSVNANSSSHPCETSVRTDEPGPAVSAHVAVGASREDMDMDSHQVIQRHVPAVSELDVAHALSRTHPNFESENLKMTFPGDTVSPSTELPSQKPDEMGFIKVTDLFGSDELQEALLGSLYHKQSNVFCCCICDRKFKCCERVHEHLFWHFSVPLFSCTVCQFSCSLKADLIAHWQQVHPGMDKAVDSLLVKNELLQLLKQERPLTPMMFREMCQEITETAKKLDQSNAEDGHTSPSKPAVASQNAADSQCSEGSTSVAAQVTPAPNLAGHCGVKSSTRSMLSLSRRASKHQRLKNMDEQETKSAAKHASGMDGQQPTSSKKRKMHGESPARPKFGTYRVVKAGSVSKCRCNACGSMTPTLSGMASHLGKCTCYRNTQPVSKRTDVANFFAPKMRLSQPFTRAAGLMSADPPEEVATVSKKETRSKSEEKPGQPSKLKMKGRSNRNLRTQYMSKHARFPTSWARKMLMRRSPIMAPSSLSTEASSTGAAELTASEQETLPVSEESSQEPVRMKAKRRVDQIVDSSIDEDGDDNVELNRGGDSKTGEAEQIFTCKYCKFSASSTQKDELLAHLQSMHTHLLKLSKCGHCDYVHGNLDRLKKHMANHHPDKPELKEAAPLTCFYNAKEKENCSPKRGPVEEGSEARELNVVGREPTQKQKNMAKRTGLKLGPSETESKMAGPTAQVPAAKRRNNSTESAKPRVDLPQQIAHIDKDTPKNSSTSPLELEKKGQEKPSSEEMIPVISSDAVQHPREREGPSGREDSGRSAAKQARLTMQSQLQEEGRNSSISDSDEEESDSKAHQRQVAHSEGKRFAFLDAKEFQKDKKAMPKPKSKPPVGSAVSQSSPGPSSQSANSTRLVPDHITAAPASTPACTPMSTSLRLAGKVSREANRVSMALDAPASGSQQTESKKLTSAERNQLIALGNYRYICVMCNQYHMEQRGIMAHLTRHINYRTIHCGTCSMEFITLKEAESHHAAMHPGTPFNRTVCRDPKVDMRLSQLVAQSKAKAEKERVPLVARNPSMPQKDPENQQLTAPSVEWKQSIQCRQCQILLDSISMFKAHCEREHGGVHEKMEWVDVKSQGVYELNGNLVQEGPGSLALMHKYLCAYCPFRGTHRDVVMQHKEQVHADLAWKWIVALRVTPLASSSRQPNLATRNTSSATAATVATAAPASASTATVSCTPATQSPASTKSTKNTFASAACRMAQGQQSSSRETGDDEASICMEANSTGHRVGDLHSDVKESAEGSDGEDSQSSRGREDLQECEKGGPYPGLADPKLRRRTVTVRLKDFLNSGDSKEFKELLLINNISRLQLDPGVRLSEAALEMLSSAGS